MLIEEIVFNLMKADSHNWVRYFITMEFFEHIEIRSKYLSDTQINKLLHNGFTIEKVTTVQINSDAYCEILFKRELKN